MSRRSACKVAGKHRTHKNTIAAAALGERRLANDAPAPNPRALFKHLTPVSCAFLWVRTCASNHIDRVRGHPDVDLSEADFEAFLQLAEKFAGPSTVKRMPSAASGARAASGTITSPVAQLLPEYRRARNPSARRLVSRSGKRIITMHRAWCNSMTCASVGTAWGAIKTVDRIGNSMEFRLQAARCSPVNAYPRALSSARGTGAFVSR